MSDAVTSLFAWGAECPPANVNVVEIVVVSGFRSSQLVSYARGQLQNEKFTGQPAKFTSAPEGITQQFSDRTIELPGQTTGSLGTSQNFAATKADTLNDAY